MRYKCSGEIDRMSFPFIDLYIPAPTLRIHSSEFALQFAEDTTFVLPCRVNTGIVREQSKMSSGAAGHHLYIYIYIYIYRLTVQYWGKDGTLRKLCRYFSWRRNLAFYQDFKFSVS
jgi:hypothetical protein